MPRELLGIPAWPAESGAYFGVLIVKHHHISRGTGGLSLSSSKAPVEAIVLLTVEPIS